MNKISRYEVKRELGRGGMATVFHGFDPRFQRDVAIKVLPQEFLHDPSFRTRFDAEARTIAALEHPAIIPVYDYGEQDGQPYFVMRYMVGGSLEDRLKYGKLPNEEIVNIVNTLAPGLDQGHRMGVVHRDLKPGNIMFDDHERAYLADYGIAKLIESSINLTGSSVIGTPAYMSPEQGKGDATIDGRSDQYSLAIIVFEMLTGRRPYSAETPVKLLMKHILDPIPDVRDVNGEIRPNTSQVLQKAMNKEAHNRYPTTKAFAEALAATLKGSASVSGPIITETQTQPQPTPVAVAAPPTHILPEEGKSVTTYHPPVAQAESGGGDVRHTPPAPVAASGGSGGGRWVRIVGTLVGVGALAILGILFGPTLVETLTGGPTEVPVAVVSPEANAVAAAETPSIEPTPTQTSTPVPPTNTPTSTPTNTPTPTPTLLPPVGASNIYIEYIIDASGSMMDLVDGATKLSIAQDMLTERIANMPSDVHVGLRAYGHRLPWQESEEESCEDIELVVPIQVGGQRPILEWLPTMQAQGMTPMTESIRQAVNDFTFSDDRNNSIILLSDGKESCGDDPAEAVQLLQEIGIDFIIHVIGLDVDDETSRQLEAIANAGAGVYRRADNAADLQEALEDVQDTAVEQAVLSNLAETATNVTAKGAYSASTEYDVDGLYFPAVNGVDGDLNTSWFSSGPEGDGVPTVYRWEADSELLMTNIGIYSNAYNENEFLHINFGFESVTLQILDSNENVVYEETKSLAGTPDPDVFFEPMAVGQSVVLLLNGHESIDCGGFSELEIIAAELEN